MAARHLGLWRLTLLFGLPAVVLAVNSLFALRPAGVDIGAFLLAICHVIAHPAESAAPVGAAGLAGLLVHYAWMPRLAMSLLAGAGLSLAGVMFQQVLRNPLAEPLTLGVASGASLALSAAAIWLPPIALAFKSGIALAGAAAAIAAVMALTWRSRFAPVPVILAGMIVNLYCSGLSIMVSMTHERALVGVFAWGAGSLVQNGWHDVGALVPRVLVAGLAAALLLKPLSLFALDDRSITQLGARIAWIRTAGLAVAAVLSASIVSIVGIIGFIGLAGPQLVRLAGARRLRDQLVWAPVIGALMLMLTDQIVQSLPLLDGATLPTGAAAALLGGPLLLWLLAHTRAGEVAAAEATWPARARHPLRWLALALVLGVALVWVTQHLGRTFAGWQWADDGSWAVIWPWRAPRMLASAAAGVALALAGTLLQRISGNPMASPELLGVSGGAMLGVLVVAFVAAGVQASTLFGASLAGAAASLAVMLMLSRRGGFSPTRMLLAGVAISGTAQSLVAIASAGGTANAFLLRSLMLGLTYLVGTGVATGAVAGQAPASAGRSIPPRACSPVNRLARHTLERRAPGHAANGRSGARLRSLQEGDRADVVQAQRQRDRRGRQRRDRYDEQDPAGVLDRRDRAVQPGRPDLVAVGDRGAAVPGGDHDGFAGENHRGLLRVRRPVGADSETHRPGPGGVS